MYLIYDILLTATFTTLMPYFLVKAVFANKYRKGILERLGFINPQKLNLLSAAEQVLWIHAVSMGETKAAIPLLKLLKERHPSIKIVFSNVTATGNETAIKEGGKWIDAPIFLPFDFSWVVKKVIGNLNPNLFVVIEKELWPNLFRLLKRKKVPIIIVNGTMSGRSFKRYKRFSVLSKRLFRHIDVYCAQNQVDNERAAELGVLETKITGNMKFDVKMPVLSNDEKRELKSLIGVSDKEGFIVAGSTHSGEEVILLDVYKAVRKKVPGLRLLIAPRHPERFGEVGELIKKKGLQLLRKSDLKGSKASESGNSHNKVAPVILLDTLGELGKIYSIADIVFVGGSLVKGIGGHNLLEPAAYKKPILFGPYVENWMHVAKGVEDAGGAMQVQDRDELKDRLVELFSDTAMAERVGAAAYKMASENGGATERNLEIIEGLLLRNGSRFTGGRDQGAGFRKS